MTRPSHDDLIGFAPRPGAPGPLALEGALLVADPTERSSRSPSARTR